MPIIKRAIKKMRIDEERRERHDAVRAALHNTIKTARRSPTKAANLRKAFQALDKAAKYHIIRPNKAARLKSRLSHLATAK